MVITCRHKDVKLVTAAIDVAAKVFRKKTGLHGTVVVDNSNFLPDDSNGGIELSAMKGKIKTSNTLEARLELTSHRILPQIRTDLFGKNPDRKHYN